jgi:hypothetical protein
MDTREIDHIGLSFGESGVETSDKNKEEYSRIFGYAKEWYGDLSPAEAKSLHPKVLKRRAESYVSSRAKPAGFFPGIIWWFAGRLITSYIIDRILEYIKSRQA